MKRLAWMAALVVALIVAAAYGWNPQQPEVRAQEGGGQSYSLPLVMRMPTLTPTVTPTATPPPWAVTRVSVSTTGEQGNSDSTMTDISLDARYVVYSSIASNPVPNDTNGVRDTFVHDRVTKETTRVSVASDGTQANGNSIDGAYPAVSGDGRYVAFTSAATNLVSGDTNGRTDLFIRDRLTAQTIRGSLTHDGKQANNHVGHIDISADGRYVVFHSEADNLVPYDPNMAVDVFLRDLLTGEIRRISSGYAPEAFSSSGNAPSISADGRYVAFASRSRLIPEDIDQTNDIYRYDLITNQLQLVSVALDGANPNNSSFNSAISADGRFISFTSWATNLVPGDTNNHLDVFIKDMVTGELTRVSVASDGTQADDLSGYILAPPFRELRSPVSGDGRYVVFLSRARNLVPGDPTLSGENSYIHDRLTHTTGAIAYELNGQPMLYGGLDPTISGDGRFVAFYNLGDRLVQGDTNWASDVFVSDLSLLPNR